MKKLLVNGFVVEFALSQDAHQPTPCALLDHRMIMRARWQCQSSWPSKQRWKERISPQRMSPSTWSSLMGFFDILFTLLLFSCLWGRQVSRQVSRQDEREARAFACYDQLICAIAGVAQSGNTCIWDCRGHEHLCRLDGDEGRRVTSCSWRSRRSWQAGTNCGEQECWCSSREDEHVYEDYNWWTIGFPRRS